MTKVTDIISKGETTWWVLRVNWTYLLTKNAAGFDTVRINVKTWAFWEWRPWASVQNSTPPPRNWQRPKYLVITVYYSTSDTILVHIIIFYNQWYTRTLCIRYDPARDRTQDNIYCQTIWTNCANDAITELGRNVILTSIMWNQHEEFLLTSITVANVCINSFNSSRFWKETDALCLYHIEHCKLVQGHAPPPYPIQNCPQILRLQIHYSKK